MYNHVKSSELGEFYRGYAWAVPTAFAPSLNQCRFERGDVFYDTLEGYQQWDKALKQINFGVQVRSPAHAVGRAAGSQEDSQDVFGSNWKSEVVFTFTDYAKNTTREITTTQGTLYTVLWRGDNHLNDKQPAIPATCLSDSVFNELERVANEIKSRTYSHIPKPNLFVMPYDPTYPISAVKYETIKRKLTEDFAPVVEVFPPHKFGFPDFSIVPTVSPAAFLIDSEESTNIFAALKAVLYKPSADRKTDKDKFKLSAHGAFLPFRPVPKN